MRELILLYWGSVSLIYLSGIYYPNRYISKNSIGQHTYKIHMDIFMIITIIWLACFSFLRVEYNDTSTYIKMFYESDSTATFIKNGGLSDITNNPLSLLYESVIHDITDNYHIYFMFPALFNSIMIIRVCKKYSVHPAISLLIFFSLGTYIMFIAALKQCMAVVILLASISYAEKKQYFRFYILVFIAILFHTHAFMFAILPLLFEKPWGKITWGLLIVTLFAMFTYRETLGAFMQFAQSIGALVAEEELFDGHQINVIRVIVYWVPALLALIFRKRLFAHSTRMDNLFVNMSIVSAFILMIGLVEGANLYARMAGYFELSTAIALPWMIQKLFTQQSVKIMNILLIILYFGYFLYEFGIAKNFGSSYEAISFLQFLSGLFA